jgi:hypothetical protein
MEGSSERSSSEIFMGFPGLNIVYNTGFVFVWIALLPYTYASLCATAHSLRTAPTPTGQSRGRSKDMSIVRVWGAKREADLRLRGELDRASQGLGVDDFLVEQEVNEGFVQREVIKEKALGAGQLFAQDLIDLLIHLGAAMLT